MTTPLSTKKIVSTKRSTKSAQSSKKPGNAFLKRIQNFAHAHALWQRGDTILVGVSGGPDSVCLLHTLSRIAKKSNLTLRAVHINYRLRGKDSDEDERFVRSLCKEFCIPLSVYTPKTPLQKSEDAFRTIRYTRFETLRKKLGFTRIAVGHHQNDQAETVLLHLFRGCGTEGICGMSPKNGMLIRPLLPLSREDILLYLKENFLPFRKDASNDTLDYTRNIIRKKILPAIAKNIQPNIVTLLAQSAALFADDAETLDGLTPTIPIRKTLDGLCFKKSDLLALSPALQKRVLRKLLSQIRKSKKDITFGHIFELQKAIASKKNKKQIITFLGLIYERKNDTVILRVARIVTKR